MRPLTRALLAPVVLATLAGPAAAQRAGPGWIGISFEVPAVDGFGGAVVVDDVRRGSPAEEAGLRRGDHLISVGSVNTPDEFRTLPEQLRLRVGERVRIRAERDGRRFEVVVRASERPDELRTRTIRIAMEADSMVETMVEAMDSLRLHLIRARGDRQQNRTSPSRTEVRVVEEERADGVAAPFEFFVFRGEAHDSLERAMEDLNRLAEDLRRREQVRVQELSRAVRRFRNRNVDETDEELQVLRAALEDITRESAELRTAMADAARISAGAEYAIPGWTSPIPVWAPPEPGPRPEPSPDPAPAFRPLTPYIVGSNMVAGAQVVDLRPELAWYFDVEGGVLIVDVAPGTPAAMAGIVPGDVVTRLDQVAIRSVEELRFGVSRADEALPLRLVRQGNTLEVLLRR